MTDTNREAIEQAWRDGWKSCRDSLTDDEAFCLTDDVEADAWADSKTRAALAKQATAPVVGEGDKGIFILAAIAAADESGNGYDIAVLRKHMGAAASQFARAVPEQFIPTAPPA